MKKKITKTILTVLAVLLALVLLVLLGAIAYFRLSVLPYYSASEPTFAIPGLSDGFIPQGIHYDAKEGCFLVTGYMQKGGASPVYLVDKSSGELRKAVVLLQEDGTEFDGHTGGIGQYGDYVYLAGSSDHCLYVYSYAEMLSASDGGGVTCKGAFSIEAGENDYIRVSCLTVSGDRLVVGEFFRDGSHKTQTTHKLTTKGGAYNQALAVEYRLSEDAPFGIEPTPVKAYSLPDQVQGICFADGKLYLSTSYGASFSHLLAYEESKLHDEGELTLLGATVPLYSMDETVQLFSRKIAPMSEEIEIVDGKLYVMCESASKKYLFGNLIGARRCYATDLSEWGA